MCKYLVIPVLLLFLIIQADILLFAAESSETKISESIKGVIEAGAKAEVNVKKSAESLQEGEAKADEAAATVEKTLESVATVVEAEENKSDVNAGESSETKISGSVKEVAEAGAKAEVNVKKSAASLKEGEAAATVEKAVESAVTVDKAGEKVEEVKAAALKTEVKTEKSSEAVEEKENDVIATVNGEKIIRKDFERRLDVFKRLNQDVTRPVKMQIVDQLTKRMLLKQFVEGKNIEVGNDEIQEELEKITYFLQNNPNNTDKSLEEILKTQGSSITELEEEVRRTLALSKYLEKTVSDDDKKNYFNANKDAFNGARVKASHVLIDTRSMKKEAELEEARKMIEVVKAEIDKGADFADMAKKYSNCPSAGKGGDIGFFQRKGSIVEEFAKVAFGMDAGEISDPVKTQFGYHIIKVTEKEEGQDVSYEEVTDMVDFVYMQMETENILKELYEKAKIEVFL